MSKARAVDGQSNEFRYETALERNTIRLIRLRKDQEKSLIRFELESCILNKPSLSFTAISYVWGVSNKTKQVQCNGKVFRITENLFDVLSQVRRTFLERENSDSQPILLWVDAICINQADLQEKTAQVRIMHKIYQAASLVVCWLGKEQKHDQAALSLMEQIYLALGQQGTDFAPSDMRKKLLRLGLPDIKLSIWSALADFYEKPWFSRVWVIQEFLMAGKPEFWCGKHVISYDCLLNAASISLAFGGPRYPPNKTLWDSKRFGWANTMYLRDRRIEIQRSKVALLDLLRGYHEATDPIDRIFALVNLSSDFDESFINYTQSLNDVMFSLAKKILFSKDRSPFDLLVRAEPSGTRTLPSWIPELHKAPSGCAPPSTELEPEKSEDEPQPSLHVTSTRSLKIKGGVVDRIETLLGGFPVEDLQDLDLHNSTNTSIMQKIAVWDEKCWSAISALEYYPTGESLQRAYWRTLIPDYPFWNWDDHMTKDHGPPSDVSFAAWRVFLRCFLIGSTSTSISSVNVRYFRMVLLEAWKVARPFQVRFPGMAHLRQLCITRFGYIGWVHHLARPGDFVCVFQGCPVQFVIRRTTPIGDIGVNERLDWDQCLLFGICYIHGLGRELMLRSPDLSDMIELI